MSSAVWFERDELEAFLVKRVQGFRAGYRQNLALLGPEGIGKTTFLKRFLSQKVPACDLFLPLYLEVRSEDSLAEWAARFIRTLLYGVLRARGVKDLPAQLHELFEVCLSSVPRTCSSAKRLMQLAEDGRSEEVFDRLWDLPYALSQETGSLVLLVIDEFHRLRCLSLKDPFRRLGRKIMIQSSTMYLLSSSKPVVARRILQEGLALLFGQFEVVRFPSLNPSASLKAIRCVRAGKEPDPLLEHLLMELAQGYPGRLDLLLQGWKELEGVSQKDEMQRLIQLLEALFLHPKGMLRESFEARLRSLPQHRNRFFWIQVLGVVSRGIHRVPQVARHLDRPVPQVGRALRILEQSGLVTQEGVFYRIPERLFQLWMEIAYPILQGVGLIDPVQAAACFHEVAGAWIQKMHLGLLQPMPERCLELIQRWGGEQVEIEGRRILLPEFTQVEWVPSLVNRSGLWANRNRSGGKRWLVIPWAGSLDEGAAQGLVKGLREVPSFKRDRVVLMGAHPVEIHARLILQEARVRLWDLPTVNQLLELYGLVPVPVPLEAQGVLQEPVSVLENQQGPVADSSVQPRLGSHPAPQVAG